MRSYSPRQLDDALRQGHVHEPVIVLQPGHDSAGIAGHFVPQGWTPDDAYTSPADPVEAEPGAIRFARLELEVADAHVLIEDLERRLQGRSAKPRSRWRLAATRRRTAWSRLLDGSLTPDEQGDAPNG